jgi:hypothetical protein
MAEHQQQQKEELLANLDSLLAQTPELVVPASVALSQLDAATCAAFMRLSEDQRRARVLAHARQSAGGVVAVTQAIAAPPVNLQTCSVTTPSPFTQAPLSQPPQTSSPQCTDSPLQNPHQPALHSGSLVLQQAQHHQLRMPSPDAIQTPMHASCSPCSSMCRCRPEAPVEGPLQRTLTCIWADAWLLLLLPAPVLSPRTP